MLQLVVLVGKSLLVPDFFCVDRQIALVEIMRQGKGSGGKDLMIEFGARRPQMKFELQHLRSSQEVEEGEVFNSKKLCILFTSLP